MKPMERKGVERSEALKWNMGEMREAFSKTRKAAMMKKERAARGMTGCEVQSSTRRD